MPFYGDTQSFYDVMTDLFERAMALPNAREALRASGVVLRMVTTGPDAILTLDGRDDPPRFACGAADDPADFTLRLPADVLHAVWLGEIKLQDAFFGGQIQLDGSPMRALGLVSDLSRLFRQVEALYPQVLREQGLA